MVFGCLAPCCYLNECGFNAHNQGWIQDVKLGVAQMDGVGWGGGGGVGGVGWGGVGGGGGGGGGGLGWGGGCHILRYISKFQILQFFITTILYILSPLYYVVLKKSDFKIF